MRSRVIANLIKGAITVPSSNFSSLGTGPGTGIAFYEKRA